MPIAIDTLGVIFALLLLLLFVLLWRLHRNPEVELNLLDLVMENGRMSKAACVMIGAFAVTTWQMVYFTLANRMTEGYLVIYAGAWITPVVARLFKNEASAPVEAKP